MFIAIGLPVLFLVFAIVVDVGQWYVHKKALQNDADAAVFAGSQLWGSCFKTATTTPAWLPMQQEAQNYDGETGLAHNYNPQVGGTLKGTFGVAFDSTTFPLAQPPNQGPDDTPSDSCALTTLSDGKQHYIFDVKATEQNVPLIFGGAAFGINGPTLHATARTELDQVQSLNGLLPIGVTDPSPKYMLAQFVDEDASDTPITGWIPLCRIGAPGCSGTPGGGSELWSTLTTTPVSMPATSKNVGVRLKFIWAGTDNTLPCDAGSLVQCYDNVPSNIQSDGLTHIRLYPSGATGVHLNNVWMLAGSCANAYFTVSTTNSCGPGVQAEVDLGNHPVKMVWNKNSCDTGCAQVWATVDGTKYQLNPPSSLPANGLGLMTWTLPAGATVTGTGPHPVTMGWQWQQTSGTWNGLTCTSATGNPCVVTNGTFNGGSPVQRIYLGDSGVRSGPVQGITIFSDTVGSGANSFAQGTTQNLGVTVSNPCFQTEFSDPACPLVDLRVSASATGSQSQSLDCDPALPNIKDEIANGCNPSYTTYPLRSLTNPCPTQSVLDNSPNTPQDPWDCVAVQTGNGDVEGGLQQRIGTDPATCANSWPGYLATDRRQVPLFLVPYSAFNNSGSNQTYPVVGFAAFYITGYKGDPCPNATTSGVKQGTIPGHFITFLPAGKGVTPSKQPCDPLALTPCVPVLIK